MRAYISLKDVTACGKVTPVILHGVVSPERARNLRTRARAPAFSRASSFTSPARTCQEGFRVQGSGFRVPGSGFNVQCSGFGVKA